MQACDTRSERTKQDAEFSMGVIAGEACDEKAIVKKLSQNHNSSIFIMTPLQT